jgi:hypothetical protein
MRLLPLLFTILMLTSPLAAQTTAPQTSSPAILPAEPYNDDEFAPWMLKLRRFEIIAIGAFPLAYLFAGLGYDYGYYCSNGFPADNVPWPLGQGTSQWTTTSNGDKLQSKNVTIVMVSLGLSLAVAGVDWFLGLYE